MTAWDISINGVSLTKHDGVNVKKVTGLSAIAGRTYYNTSTYGSDGEDALNGGFAAGVVGLVIEVTDWPRIHTIKGFGTVDNAPVLLENRQAQALDNAQWVVSQFVTERALTMTVVRPALAGSTLTENQRTQAAVVQLLTMSDWEWDPQRIRATATFGFKIPEGFWSAAGGEDLDTNNRLVLSGTGSGGNLVLPTTNYRHTAPIEDGVITVKAGVNPIKSVTINDNGIGGISRLLISSTRTGGLLPAGATLTVYPGSYRATIASSSGTEDAFLFCDYSGVRPGSMFRLMPSSNPQVGFSLSALTSGSSLADATYSYAYTPRFV